MSNLILQQISQALVSLTVFLLLTFLKNKIIKLLKKYPFSSIIKIIKLKYFNTNKLIIYFILLLITIILILNLLICINIYSLNTIEDNIELLLQALLIKFSLSFESVFENELLLYWPEINYHSVDNCNSGLYDLNTNYYVNPELYNIVLNYLALNIDNVIEDNHHLIYKELDNQYNLNICFLICTIVGLTMIIGGIYLWYNHNNIDNNLSDITSDTESVSSTLTDTTITPYNINNNLINSYSNFSLSERIGDQIYNSANKNNLGLKDFVSNTIDVPQSHIIKLIPKIPGIKHFNLELEQDCDLSHNPLNIAYCNTNLLYSSLLPKKGTKPSVWLKDEQMWMPFISNDKKIKMLLEKEYYPVRELFLNASPDIIADPEIMEVLPELNIKIKKMESNLFGYESHDFITNNLSNVVDISNKFVYELCRASDSSLPMFGSDKHLNLLARLDSYLKINRYSKLDVTYQEFLEILSSLNLDRKIDNFQLPYVVDYPVINRDILHHPSDWDSIIDNLVD